MHVSHEFNVIIFLLFNSNVANAIISLDHLAMIFSLFFFVFIIDMCDADDAYDACNSMVKKARLRNTIMQLRKICNHPYLFHDENHFDWSKHTVGPVYYIIYTYILIYMHHIYYH